MNGERLLQQALRVFEERRVEYGSPERNLSAVAKRWSLVLGQEVSEQDVALCLLELKLARLAFQPAHIDSIIDVAGYAAVLAELIPAPGGYNAGK